MEQSPTFWMQQPLRKYATFEGRARRAELWWFVLGYFIALMIAGVVDRLLGLNIGLGIAGVFYFLVILAALLPSLAVNVRRLHDLNKSGWWIFLSLLPIMGSVVLFIWFCTKGTDGPNRFGPDPLTGDLAEVFS